MDRIRVLEESLWPQVPGDVIEEAKRAAQTEPSWIAMQGNGSAFPSYSMRYKRILAYPGRFRKESWHPWNWKMLAEVAGAIP
jgi:hypothetical protein